MEFGSATTFLAIAYITKSAAHSLTKYIPHEECTNTFFSINSALSSHTWTQKLEHYGYFGMLWIFFALSFWRTLKRKYSYGTFHRNFQHTNIYKLNTVVVLNGTRHSAHFFLSLSIVVADIYENSWKFHVLWNLNKLNNKRIIAFTKWNWAYMLRASFWGMLLSILHRHSVPLSFMLWGVPILVSIFHDPYFGPI